MERFPFNPYDFFGYLASGLLVVVGMQFVLGFPPVLGHDFKVVDGSILLLAVYVAGQIMAGSAKAVIEDGIVANILGNPSTTLFREKQPFLRNVLFRGFYKPLPRHTRERIVRKAKSEGATGVIGEELFLHVRFSTRIRNDERLATRLDGFLNQYGFARNLAFTAVIVGIAFLLKSRLVGDAQLLRYGITAITAGLLLFYRYLKFFRQYSYELFNTYGHDHDDDHD